MFTLRCYFLLHTYISDSKKNILWFRKGNQSLVWSYLGSQTWSPVIKNSEPRSKVTTVRTNPMRHL